MTYSLISMPSVPVPQFTRLVAGLVGAVAMLTLGGLPLREDRGQEHTTDEGDATHGRHSTMRVPGRGANDVPSLSQRQPPVARLWQERG